MIKKIALFLIYLSVAILGALVTIKNSHLVAFNYYMGSVEMPLVVLLFLTFMLGALITMVIAYLVIFRRNRQIKRLERSKQVVEKKLDQTQNANTTS